MKEQVLYHSKKWHGAVMNRHGVVIYNGRIIEDPIGQRVVKEAMDDGWTRTRPGGNDVGLVFQPPQPKEENAKTQSTGTV